MLPISNQMFSQLDACQMQFVIDNCNQIKNYQSQFPEIRDAIDKLQVIPESDMSFYALSMLQDFNEQIAPLKEAVGYYKNITNLKQLDALEGQLIKIEFNLKNICKYSSGVKLINKTTNTVLQHSETGDAPQVITECNDQMIPMDCNEDMFTEEQLGILRKRLLNIGFRLRQIQKYQSRFEYINQVIQSIPRYIVIQNVLILVKRFNEQLATLKQITDYHEDISTVQQLDVLESRLVKCEVDLKQIRQHQSSHKCIDQAIKNIPKCIEIDKVLQIIELFNAQLASCKTIACYYENICNEKQIIDLEQRLNSCDQALAKIWHAFHITNKPYLNTISLIREWFNNPQNQFLLDQVTSLKLVGYNISLIPLELLKLRNLQELDLSVNNISVLPDWLNQLKVLKVLKISCNRLTKLPTGISRCISLESLDMSNNQIKEFPREVLQINNLQKLDLSINEITMLPFSIYRCKALKILNLSYNRLKELPLQLCHCFNLESLDVSFNLIENLPLGLNIWNAVKKILLKQESVHPRHLGAINLSGNFLSSLSFAII